MWKEIKLIRKYQIHCKEIYGKDISFSLSQLNKLTVIIKEAGSVLFNGWFWIIIRGLLAGSVTQVLRLFDLFQFFEEKKNIIYVYPPFEDYFRKYNVLLDYGEIDLSWIDFIMGQICANRFRLW